MDQNNKLTHFHHNGKKYSVSFGETIHVTTGVECDTYTFESDTSRDLAIVRVQPNCKTPLQKILQGDTTIEGWISGEGTFVLIDSNGNTEEFLVGSKNNENFEIHVKVGDCMRWYSDNNDILTFYEICYPPYQDGRFENLEM